MDGSAATCPPAAAGTSAPPGGARSASVGSRREVDDPRSRVTRVGQSWEPSACESPADDSAWSEPELSGLGSASAGRASATSRDGPDVLLLSRLGGLLGIVLALPAERAGLALLLMHRLRLQVRDLRC